MTGRTRAAAQDEQGRALVRGVVVLWFMVQPVRVACEARRLHGRRVGDPGERIG